MPDRRGDRGGWPADLFSVPRVDGVAPATPFSPAGPIRDLPRGFPRARPCRSRCVAAEPAAQHARLSPICAGPAVGFLAPRESVLRPAWPCLQRGICSRQGRAHPSVRVRVRAALSGAPNWLSGPSVWPVARHDINELRCPLCVKRQRRSALPHQLGFFVPACTSPPVGIDHLRPA